MKNTFDPRQTACFTGHRTLQPSAVPALCARTASALQHAYSNGYRTFLCGGARGFDTLAALEVIRFRECHSDVRLIIAVPCKSQADRWPAADINKYHLVLSNADDVRILSDFYYNGCMQVRNRFMVDASSLCFCYLIRFEGGTWSTVRYAMHCGLLLKNLAISEQASSIMKEKTWNFTFISPSALKNVNTVHLSLSPLLQKKKMHISRKSCGKLS